MIGYNELRVLTFLVGLLVSINGQECVWNKDSDFPENPPLILEDIDGHILLPVLEGDDRIVRIPSGSALTIACSNYALSAFDGVPAITAVCVQDLVLDVDGMEYTMQDMGCTHSIKESIFRDQDTCGDGNIGSLHQIGFETFEDQFYPLIDVCFEKTQETTLWTEHVVHGHSIAAKEIDPSRPSFKTSTGFFTVPMSTVYSQKAQLQLMIEQLGDEDLANSIIDTHKEWYFAKGHMSPDADFVTEAEQDATYYFINALPQWQAFNNGNWKHMEERTRELAEEHGTDMRVISGGFNILNLDDVNGNPVEIFLGDTEGEKVVPAPAITWKVVFEEGSNKAAALIGINNPHIDVAPEPLCTDICDQLLWIDFDVSDLAHGYTYCCTVEDLRAAIPNVPDIGSVDLLDK